MQRYFPLLVPFIIKNSKMDLMEVCYHLCIFFRYLMTTFNCIIKIGVICAGVAQPGLECQSTQKGNTHNLEVVGSKPTPGTTQIV